MNATAASQKQLIIGGDIGGTNTRLGAFTRERGLHDPVAVKSYPSRKHNSLEEIINLFQEEFSLQASLGCFGVAGPVKNNRAVITNLSWVIDGQLLTQDTSLEKAVLLNDIEAMAYALPALDEEDLQTINIGKPQPRGVKALIAAGTGLGEVFMTWNGDHYHAYSSEGGHTEFGPRTPLEAELLAYMQKKYSHVSYERVCSGGLGIPDLYRFLRDSGRFPEPPELVQQLSSADDWTPVIVNTVLNTPGKYPLFDAVVDLFLSILAAQAGNLAITVCCYGGLYVGGGIPPRLLTPERWQAFLDVFMDKGRLSSVVEDVPIYLITQSDCAILGAGSYAFGL